MSRCTLACFAALAVFFIVGCGKSNTGNSPSASNSSPAAPAASPAPGGGSPQATGGSPSPGASLPPAAQPQSDADTAKSAAAAGDWDKAITTARKVIWTDGNNEEMIALLQNAIYQRATQKAQAALAAGDLDTALDNAQIAFLHNPDSKDAADLLQKARSGIASSLTYYGKYSVITKWGVPGQARCFMADGKKIVLSLNGGGIGFFDPATRQIQQLKLNGAGDDLYDKQTGAAIHRDSFPGDVTAFDAGGKTLWTYKGPIDRIDLSPDGLTVVCTAADNTVKFVSAATGQILGQTPKLDLGQIAGPPRPLVFTNNDGSLAAYPTRDGKWNIFDVKKGVILHSFDGGTDILAADFSEDGKFAYSNAIEVSTADTSNWKELTTIEISGDCKFVNGGKQLLVSTRQQGSSIYDTSTSQKIGGTFAQIQATFGDSDLIFGWLSGESPLINVYRSSDGKKIGGFPEGEQNSLLSQIVDHNSDGALLFSDGTIVTRPTFPGQVTIQSLPARPLPFGDAALADANVELKREHGMEVMLFAGSDANNLQFPAGLDGIIPPSPDPDDIKAFNEYLTHCLKDRSLMDGTPGFYVCFEPRAGESAWLYYPGKSPSPFSSGQISRLEAVLANIAASGPPSEAQILAFIQKLNGYLQGG